MIRAACADLASWPPLSAVWGGVVPRNQHAPGLQTSYSPLPQFPLSRYLTWSVLPKCSGPLGTPGPASLSRPCPATTCAGPLGTKAEQGLGAACNVAAVPGNRQPRPRSRRLGLLEFVFFPPSLRCCVCVSPPPQLPHGRQPPFLAACSQGRDPRPHPGVAAPARPLPAVTSSPACPAPAPLGLLGI